MKIYDISQEVFSSVVFPGDPSPKRRVLSSMSNGAAYNLTAFSMCAHNGTHIDAPSHFLADGKCVDEISIEKLVGMCFVFECNGDVTANKAQEIIRRAKVVSPDAAKRILLKGDLTVTLEAAREFLDSGVELIGNESQTVGPEDAPMAVHLTLLQKGIVLLEGVRLREVPCGVYLLNAAPLCLRGAEGSPCRAILMAMDDAKQ